MTANTGTANNTENTETIKDETPELKAPAEAPATGEGLTTPEPEAPAAGKDNAATKQPAAHQFSDSLNKLLSADKSKRSSMIEKLGTIECSQILCAYGVPAVKEAIVKRIGKSESESLLDAVAIKVQIWAYEINNACRVETLDKDATGHGLYAAQAPMGGIGFEVGFVERKDDDDTNETNRSAFGVYFRGSTYEAHAFTEEQQRKGKELADMLMS